MSRPSPVTQAALYYATPPELAFPALLEALNQATGDRIRPALMPGDGTTQTFALFTNVAFHATVAILDGAPDIDTSDALSLPGAPDRETLRGTGAHVVVTVGIGPSAMAFDPPKPVPVKTRLDVMMTLVTLIAEQARPLAVHLCPSDRLFRPEAILQAARPLPPSLLTRPVQTWPMQTGPVRTCPADTHSAQSDPDHADTNPIGPDPIDSPGAGHPRNPATPHGLIAHQSELLIGRTLELSGIPAPVPFSMAVTLAESLLRQAQAGRLALADGDTITSATEAALHVRHAPPDAAFPAGRIVVSFEEHAHCPHHADDRPYAGHRGYAASRGGGTGPEDAWAPQHGLPAPSSGHGSPTWMILLAIGLFLWVGLPLMEVPQRVVREAFSSPLSP